MDRAGMAKRRRNAPGENQISIGDALAKAARVPGQALIGLAVWATAAFRGADLKPVCEALIERMRAMPDDAEGLLDLSIVLQLLGQRELGVAAQRNALALRRSYRLLCGHDAADLRVLLLMAPGDLAQNNTVEFLLGSGKVALTQHFVGPTLLTPDSLPAHDVLMVGVCESLSNRPLLERLAIELAAWPMPVVNRPGKLAATARDVVSTQLAGIEGLWVPPTSRLSHTTLGLATEGTDIAAPFIIRPVDSQKGRALSHIATRAQLDAFLAANGSGDYFVAPYVDYRSTDGYYRKFRILLIDGQPLLCHVAISEHWVVHYMSAGMTAPDAAGQAKRDEEARWMRDFDSAFLARHGAALAEIAQRLELDYVGLDCGVSPDGRLLLFEADAGMTVHLMDPPDVFPYKQVQMPKVFAAFEQMLMARRQG